MNIVDRLKIYMDHIGLQISQFADNALIPRPTLSQILSGRNKKISNEVLTKLHVAYPSLNIAWLLFGDGPMDIYNLNESQTEIPKEKIAPKSETTRTQEDEKENAPQTQTTIEQSINIPPQMADTLSGINNQQTVSLSPDTSKKIQTIMVFYSDSSFEIFTPSQR